MEQNISPHFDTAEKRLRIAKNAFKRFGYTTYQNDDETICAMKDERANLYKHIEGEILIFFNFNTSEIITVLQHEKRGLTALLRVVFYKKQLVNIIGNPRHHTGLKPHYLKLF